MRLSARQQWRGRRRKETQWGKQKVRKEWHRNIYITVRKIRQPVEIHSKPQEAEIWCCIHLEGWDTWRLEGGSRHMYSCGWHVAESNTKL